MLLLAFVAESMAQKHSPSLIFKNHVISYNIVRYSPVWEIQEGGETGSKALAASRLFRNVRASETSTLDLSFKKGNEPDELKGRVEPTFLRILATHDQHLLPN